MNKVTDFKKKRSSLICFFVKQRPTIDNGSKLRNKLLLYAEKTLTKEWKQGS